MNDQERAAAILVLQSLARDETEGDMLEWEWELTVGT